MTKGSLTWRFPLPLWTLDSDEKQGHKTSHRFPYMEVPVAIYGSSGKRAVEMADRLKLIYII